MPVFRRKGGDEKLAKVTYVQRVYRKQIREVFLDIIKSAVFYMSKLEIGGWEIPSENSKSAYDMCRQALFNCVYSNK